MEEILNKLVLEEKSETSDGKVALIYLSTENLDDAREVLSKLTEGVSNLDSYIKELEDDMDGSRKITGVCLALKIEKDTGEIRVCTISPTAEDKDGAEDIDCIDISLSHSDILSIMKLADCDAKLIKAVKAAHMKNEIFDRGSDEIAKYIDFSIDISDKDVVDNALSQILDLMDEEEFDMLYKNYV